MRMRASRWLRRVELSLWIVGISLLAVALEATADRWQYQAQQERALFSQAEGWGSEPAARSPESGAVKIGAFDSGGSAHYEVAIGPELPEEKRTAVLASPVIENPVEPRDVPPRIEKDSRSETAMDPATLGLIEIPRLGLSAIVRAGADEATLARAVGLVPGTAKPGEIGNSVLAGHRDTFFRSLSRIEVDDRIRLVVPPHTYEYRVASLRVVKPDETSVMNSNGIEELTLVTCYPFRFIGPAPDRFIVSATRVH